MYLYLTALPLIAPLTTKLPNKILSVPALFSKIVGYCEVSLENLVTALCIGCFNLDKLIQSKRSKPAAADPLMISRS